MKNHTNVKKLLVYALLAGLMCVLSGCMGQLQERPMLDLTQVDVAVLTDAPQADGVEARDETVLLYFLDEEGMELLPVSRTIAVEGGMSRSEAALRTLLAGPAPGERAFWPEIGVMNASRGYELSGGVATVDLPARARALSTEALYAVRMAITHTLTEFSEVAYVNVLVGGREEGFDLAATMPMGTLSRTEDLDVAARYLRQDDVRQSAQDTGITRMTTLYFPSEDGRWLLPEVRNVTYAALTPIEYLYTILEEFGKGTENALCMDVPAPMKYIEEMPEIVRTEDGAYRAIEICLDTQIDAALQEAGLTRGVYLAMLTNTLMGFVPGVEGVLVRIGGEQVTGLAAQETPNGQEMAFAQTLATRSDFDGYVGAPGVIYMPDVKKGVLLKETCVLSQAGPGRAREVLWQLTQRLVQADILDHGLMEEDILAVYVGDRRVLINLSAAYGRQIAALTGEQECLVVYAMVNTLTEGSVERAAFFVEGKQVQRLAGGLEMRGDFLRNPGMVVEN
ncbi:MAG: GerMN domain-containing protein [Clostridia bacterium]|nr:GerMN domain-containing protein [Clostridia bacterium]